MFFKDFPTIEYNNKTVKNILTNVKLNDLVQVSGEAFYPYTLQPGDRPWMIAEDYYGRPQYEWLVLLSNNIIDPYYEWHMNTVDFENFIKRKYGSIAAAKETVLGYEERFVIGETALEEVYDEYNDVVYQAGDVFKTTFTRRFFSVDSYNFLLSNSTEANNLREKTFDAYSNSVSELLVPIDAYTQEDFKNEERRNIKLLNRIYIRQAEEALQAALS